MPVYYRSSPVLHLNLHFSACQRIPFPLGKLSLISRRRSGELIGHHFSNSSPRAPPLAHRPQCFRPASPPSSCRIGPNPRMPFPSALGRVRPSNTTNCPPAKGQPARIRPISRWKSACPTDPEGVAEGRARRRSAGGRSGGHGRSSIRKEGEEREEEDIPGTTR